MTKLDVGLALLTLFFIQGVYGNYRAGKTYYVTTQEPIAKYDDNPTVTICFESRVELEMGRDFTAEYWYDDGEHWTFMHNVDGTMFTKLKVADDGEIKSNCFMFKKMKVDITSQNKQLVLDFYFDEEDIVETPWVYFTSETNAHGAVAQRWFDGEVNRFQLRKDHSVTVGLENVHQHEYLSQHCSDRSFYECLASNLTDAEDCASHGGLCEAVSLPSVHFPPCPNPAAHNCSLNAFWAAFDKESQCKKEKSCSAMEYRIHAIGWAPLDHDWTYRLRYGFPDPEDHLRRDLSIPTRRSTLSIWSGASSLWWPT